MDAEVIVVGAGPAGATAACELARLGRDVLLLDKAGPPRPKTCAGWVNRRVPEMFPWVDMKSVETPFTGIEFHSLDLAAKAAHASDEPLGYLADRSEFDAALVRAAQEAGARFQVAECSAAGLDGSVTLADGARLVASVVIGADGVQSVVGSGSGLNPGWDNRQLVICATTEFKMEPADIDAFYGEGRTIHVVPAYSFVSGYGWVFPKKTHISAGIGGRLHDTNNIAGTFRRFVGDCVQKGLLPESCRAGFPASGLTPAGAALAFSGFTGGRIVLVGDAGGFVSATSGEGIFPGMWSGKIAAEVIADALEDGDVEAALRAYPDRCRTELAGYIKPPTDTLPMMLQELFSRQGMAASFAAAFLDGKDL